MPISTVIHVTLCSEESQCCRINARDIDLGNKEECAITRLAQPVATYELSSWVAFEHFRKLSNGESRLSLPHKRPLRYQDPLAGFLLPVPGP
jgi:hypothetical protein